MNGMKNGIYGTEVLIGVSSLAQPLRPQTLYHVCFRGSLVPVAEQLFAFGQSGLQAMATFQSIDLASLFVSKLRPCGRVSTEVVWQGDAST
jgi:hypothetical protein